MASTIFSSSTASLALPLGLIDPKFDAEALFGECPLLQLELMLMFELLPLDETPLNDCSPLFE